MTQRVYDTVIIGGGPAGYTAGLYATRSGLDTLVIEKFCAGGQMTQTQQIDNYPGFFEGVDGFTLGEYMQKIPIGKEIPHNPHLGKAVGRRKNYGKSFRYAQNNRRGSIGSSGYSDNKRS